MQGFLEVGIASVVLCLKRGSRDHLASRLSTLAGLSVAEEICALPRFARFWRERREVFLEAM